jgi:hypothetical protein
LCEKICGLLSSFGDPFVVSGGHPLPAAAGTPLSLNKTAMQDKYAVVS